MMTQWFDACPYPGCQVLIYFVQATGPLDEADGTSIIGLLNGTNLDAWRGAMDALRAKEPALAG
jgi:hypothetical protein